MSPTPPESNDATLGALPPLPSRFTVRARIGQGGVASVYLAHDAVSGTDVALKILHRHLQSDPLVLDRFKREIAAVRRINHPNVVAIHDLIMTEGVACLVLEHHGNLDLKRHLRRHGPLNSNQTIAVALQILDGLGAAHEQGIIHRDLKPQNILIDAAGRVKLTDFGIAHVDDAAQLTSQTMMLGTPEYMAPELLDSPIVDTRADLYGLGATLFELVTGHLPYNANNPMALVRLHESGKIPDPRTFQPDMSDTLARTIVKALQHDPQDRFATASEMKEALLGQAGLLASTANPFTEKCLRCGVYLLPGTNACIECGHEPITLKSGDSGGYRVVIDARKRNTNDPLTFEQKHDLVATLREFGGEVRLSIPELDARLRSLPLVVANGLTEMDAQKLSQEISAKAIPNRMEPISVWHFLPHLFSPAAVVAGAGSALGGLFFVAIVQSGWLLGLPLVTGLFGSIATARRRLRSVADWKGKAGSQTSLDGLHVEARKAFLRITSTRIRKLLRRILGQGLQLQDHLRGSSDYATELHVHLQNVLLAALQQALALGALEHASEANDPRALFEEIQTLDEKIASASTVSETDDWIEKKREISRRIADEEDRRKDMARATGDLLLLSEQLGRIGLQIAQTDRDPEENLSTLIAELDLDLQSQQELERSLRR